MYYYHNHVVIPHKDVTTTAHAQIIKILYNAEEWELWNVTFTAELVIGHPIYAVLSWSLVIAQCVLQHMPHLPM